MQTSHSSSSLLFSFFLLSYRFSIGSFALFVPPKLLLRGVVGETAAVVDERVRVAFNRGADRYFLAGTLDESGESESAASDDASASPTIVLGRISAIEDDLAGPKGDARYGVPPFTAFHLVTLERM